MPIKTTLDRSSGNTDLVPTTLWFFPVREAWQRMRDLHRCAIGAAPAKASVYTAGLTPWRANGYYHSAVAAALGQIAVTATPTRMKLLESVVKASAAFRSIEGLESVYGSLLSAAAAEGATKDFENALNNLEGLGVPDTLGAGALSSPVFNAQDGSLSFLNQKGFASLLGQGKGNFSASSFNGLLSDLGISGVMGSSGMRGTGGLGMVRPSNASEVSDDNDYNRCVADWTMGIAVSLGTGTGLLAGALGSETGPLDAAIAYTGFKDGFAFGAALGAWAGTHGCGHSSSSKSDGKPVADNSSSSSSSSQDQSQSQSQNQQSQNDSQNQDSGSSTNGTVWAGGDPDDTDNDDGDNGDLTDPQPPSDDSGTAYATPKPGDAGDATGGDGKLNTIQFGTHGGDPTDQINYSSGSGKVDPGRVSGGDIDPLDGDDGKHEAGAVNLAYLPGSGVIDPIDDGPKSGGGVSSGPVHGGTPVASVMPTTALASSQIKATAHGFRMEGLPSFDSNGRLVSEGALGGKLLPALREGFHLEGGTANTVRERGGMISTVRDTIRRGPSR